MNVKISPAKLSGGENLTRATQPPLPILSSLHILQLLPLLPIHPPHSHSPTPIHPLPLNQSSQQATTPAPSGAGVVSIICSHVGV
ncbi:MAG: hypothetical protein IKJ46_06535 [Tidjanibacter sp.]|nr:hypothetical protein [Tidjanibacter sp.]